MSEIKEQLMGKKIRPNIAFIFGIVFFCFNPINAQSINEINKDTLNKFDINEKRTGYWIDFLDNQLLPTNNQKEIVCFRFVYFEDDDPVGIVVPTKEGKLNVIASGNNFKSKDIIILSGTYSFYTKKGKLIAEETYDKGIPTKFQEFRNGNVKALINFQKKYQDQIGSWHTTIYKKDGSILESYYYGKVDGKWKQVFDKQNE